MKPIITTSRLFLRTFVPEDGIHLYQMNMDREVIRYTGDGPFPSEKVAIEFATNYDHYRRYGMGRWAVIRKEDQAFIGWCGLKTHPENRLVEVGYRLYRQYWGNGYATEAAKAVVNYGFEALKLKEIFAHVHHQNVNSHKVVLKAGLQYQKDIFYDHANTKLYQKKNPLYTVKKIAANDTYHVRHAILRKGQPLDTCSFEGDQEISTLHLGLNFRSNLVGVISFMEKKLLEFPENTHYQLRGMAILEDFQNKGLGELLVTKGETLLKAKNSQRIWMNARKKAINFYLRLGYQVCGEVFDVPLHGPHIQMTKKL